MQIPSSLDVLISLTWVLAHSLLWLLVGRALSIGLRMQPEITALNVYLRSFLLLSLGFSGHLFVLFFLGVLGLFQPFIGLALCALIGGLGLRGLRLKAPTSSDLLSAIPQALLALFAFGYVLQFAIRAPGYWDDTSFHLPIARFYLEQGGFALAEHLRFPLFPQHMNLIMAQGLSLQGECLAQMFATWPLWLLMLGLYGAALHWLRSAFAGLLACILPFLLLPIASTLGYAYTDLGLAALAMAGAVPLMLAAQKDKSPLPQRAAHRLPLLSGLLLGTAASMKLFGLIWALGWIVLCLAHTSLRRGIGWVVLGCVIAGAGWYVRALWMSGDPFHPLLGDWLGHFLWSAADLSSQRDEQATHGVPLTILAPWTAFIKAGVLWLFPALLAGLVLTRRDRGLGLAWLAYCGYVLFWLKAGQVDRYLAPGFGLGCFLVVVGLWRFGLGRLIHRLLWVLDQRTQPLFPSFGSTLMQLTRHAGAIALAQMVLVFPLTKLDWVDAPARLSAWASWLNGRAGYTLYQRANEVNLQTPAKPLIQVGFENGVYFFNGRTVGDWFGPGRYSQFIICTDRCRMRPARDVSAIMGRWSSELLLIHVQRFQIDRADYLTEFELVSEDNSGLLLRRLSARGRPQ